MALAVSPKGQSVAASGWNAKQVLVFSAKEAYVNAPKNGVQADKSKKSGGSKKRGRDEDRGASPLLKPDFSLAVTHVDCVTALAFADEVTLISGGLDGLIKTHDLVEARQVGSVGAGKAVRCLAYNHSTTNKSIHGYLCAAHEDGRSSLWRDSAAANASANQQTTDENKQQQLTGDFVLSKDHEPLRGHMGAPSSLLWLPNNAMRVVSAGAHDGCVKVYDVRNAKVPVASVSSVCGSGGVNAEKKKISVPRKLLCMDATMLGDRLLVFTGGDDGKVQTHAFDAGAGAGARSG